MASGWAGLDFAWQLLAFRAGFYGFNNFEQFLPIRSNFWADDRFREHIKYGKVDYLKNV